MDIGDLINGYQPKDIIERWNDPLVSRDLSIYTPLSKDNLASFFQKYRNDLACVEKDKDSVYVRHYLGSLENELNGLSDYDYDMWGGMINKIEPYNRGEFDNTFGFKSESEIFTDIPFESIMKMGDLDFLDKYFLEWKRLRKGLNEEGVPHYLSMKLMCPNGKNENFLLGGVNNLLEPYVPSESMFLVDANIFSKDEWFFKSKKKF